MRAREHTSARAAAHYAGRANPYILSAMLAGILTGLAAALAQSLSFLGSRHFAHGRKNSSRALLVLGHLWMGLMAGVLLIWQWPRGAGGWGGVEWLGRVWVPVVLMTVFYLFGQLGITLALRHAEPSRVSPLMGIKIIFLAGLSAFLPQPQYETVASAGVGLTGLQWAGVVLSVVAAVSLNYAGSALRRRAVGAILLACVAFAGADWNIAATNRDLHRALPGASLVQVTLLNVGLCYGLAAVPALVMAPFWGTRKGKDLVDALPFAAAWFSGMLFLYGCYALVGPLLGVILQSTRGIISILIGSVLIHLGHLHMEPHSTRGVLLRRLAAGTLMFAAVSLYVIKHVENIKIGSWHLP